MTLGARIREERKRLGLNQTEFAAIAGASKRAMVNWEGDGAAPLVTAVISWAEAGADALYILTGRRSVQQSDDAVQADELIAAIRRDMLVTAWEPHDGEDGTAAEARVLAMRAFQLQSMMRGRAGFKLTEEQQEEVEILLNVIGSPLQLAAFRAADRVQLHSRRRRLRERIHAHTDLGDYHPTEAAIDTMTTLALDHGAPIDLLSRLFYEIVVGEDEPGWPEEGGEKAPT